MFFKINTTGCNVRKGLVEVRYDLYLEPTDYGYSEHYVQVPVIPEGGYPNQKELDEAIDSFKKWESSLPTDKNGESIFPENYKELPVYVEYEKEIKLSNDWYGALPTVYQHNPFCCHFCQFEPNVTDAEIEFVGKLALDMKYKDWVNGNLALSKNQPVTYSTNPAKIASCKARVEAIKAVEWTAVSLEK